MSPDSEDKSVRPSPRHALTMSPRSRDDERSSAKKIRRVYPRPRCALTMSPGLQDDWFEG